jgi:ribosomal subunit interface protein
MSYRITSEDFELTEAIEQAVKEKVEKLNSHLGTEGDFEVFLSKSGPEYQVKLETRVHKHDLVSTANGDEFYATLNKAKKVLLRQIDDLHSKEVTAKKH